MARRLIIFLGLLWAVVSPLAFGAETCVVQGTVTDAQGKPVAGAVVELTGVGIGTHYLTRTDKRGFYIQVGVEVGTYRIEISKEGLRLAMFSPVEIHFGERANPDMALAASDATHPRIFNFEIRDATTGSTPLSPQQRALQELRQLIAQAPPRDDNLKKEIDQKIQACRAAEQQGNWDLELADLNDIVHMDPTNDVAWAAMGFRYLSLGKLGPAIAAYLKAVTLKPGAAAYHNNLAVAYSKEGQVDEAVAQFSAMASADPGGAAKAYLYAGVLLSQRGQAAPALEFLGKAIAADPSLADAYYWKGFDLVKAAEATAGKVPPPGAAEAFRRYLELKPGGNYADAARAQLARLGG